MRAARAWRALPLGMAVVAALGCGIPEPERLPRVAGAEPADGAAPEGLVAAVTFTAPIAAEDVAGGRRIAVATAAAEDAVREALEAEEGAGPIPGAIPAGAALVDGGRRVELRPDAPLLPLAGYVLVVSSRLRAADGRPVLDPEGRQRPFVHAFTTGPSSGPPPRAVVTEVRADAETPEAGGEYVEIQNAGAAPLELAGLVLAKRTATGTLVRCVLAAAEGGPVPPGGYAVVGGGAWDGRYALPAGTPRYACGATALLGGLANDRGPAILLLGADGATLSSFGIEAAAPRCPAAAERVAPLGPDAEGNLACAEGEGTPGACNSVTAPWDC